jgi:hypothetical protein
MIDTLNIVILLALAAPLIALVFGLYTLFRGGDFSRSWSNKAMRMRVLLQFIAVVVLVTVAWWRART